MNEVSQGATNEGRGLRFNFLKNSVKKERRHNPESSQDHKPMERGPGHTPSRYLLIKPNLRAHCHRLRFMRKITHNAALGHSNKGWSRRITHLFKVNALAWLGLLLTSGCQQDGQIAIYEVIKDQPFVLPSNWEKADNASSMRLATFRITGEANQSAEVAILPMPDLQVADHEIVNLWRQQLQLTPIGEDEMDANSRAIAIGSMEGRLFDLTAAEGVPGDMAGMRIVTAFVKAPTGTWFFKLSGQGAFLESNLSGFEDFLASVDLYALQGAIQTSSMPPATGSQPRANPPSNSTAQVDLPDWVVPSTWKETGPRSMILASFAADGDGGLADITLSSLGGGAGGLLPNINRWRRQIGLPPTDAEGVASMTEAITVGEQTATLVALEGQDQSILAAILPFGDQTWFIKAMGPSKAIDRETDVFRQFVQSISFE